MTSEGKYVIMLTILIISLFSEITLVLKCLMMELLPSPDGISWIAMFSFVSSCVVPFDDIWRC